MEPRIQYVKTSDGVNIAYAAFGKGPPIVSVSSMFGGLHMATHGSRDSQVVHRLVALGWQVITYDMRGAGSSERDCDDFSLKARLRDVEAVVDRAAPEQKCAVAAWGTGGPVAITHAVQDPRRVSHLILRNTYANGAERDETLLGMVVARALRPIVEQHWEFFTLTLANALVGYTDSDLAKEEGEAFRTGMSPQVYVASTTAMDRIDATGLLESVQVPCLIVHEKGNPSVAAGTGPVARMLASRIPNARLVMTDDPSRAIDEFLREGGLVPAKTTVPPVPSSLVTILFTDVEGSTALTDRLGDAGARDVMREHERITREALKAHGGSEVKTMGDGFMASFGSVTKAVECAVAIQRAFVAGNADLPYPAHGRGTPFAEGLGEGIRVRIGLNAGEPIEEEGDLFGSTVILAARIAAQAGAGEILVSDVIRQLVTGKGFLFTDRGEQTLKGFEEPIRVHEVRWREAV